MWCAYEWHIEFVCQYVNVFLFYVNDRALCTRCGKIEEEKSSLKKNVNERTTLKALLHIYAQQQG